MNKTVLISNGNDSNCKIRLVKVFVALRNTENVVGRPDAIGKDEQDLHELSGMLMWHDSNHIPDEYAIDKLDKWISLHANHKVISIVTTIATMDSIKELHGENFIKDNMRKLNIDNIILYMPEINTDDNIIGQDLIHISHYKNNKSKMMKVINMDIRLSEGKADYCDNVKIMENNIRNMSRK